MALTVVVPIGGLTMATVALGRSLVTPTDEEAKAAGESGRTLAAHLSDDGLKLAVKNGTGSEELVLPAPAARLLIDLLTELGRGNAVALDTVQPELTTQQAADLLNVSRPYLVKLLDDGVIPSRKIGTHRRVLREDLLAFKRDNDLKRQQALDELSALDQELGLYGP
jgi:excisionase family DNA binding protein